jgi:protein tyrosine phosphatase (PTP) superfamily phosphohydrolase (DUF442 family)
LNLTGKGISTLGLERCLEQRGLCRFWPETLAGGAQNGYKGHMLLLLRRAGWTEVARISTFWLGFLMALGVCEAGQRGLPAQEGILNFGKVSETLYRGAQPDAAGLTNLHRLGIKTVINLRLAGEGWKAEAVEAQAAGLVYTNVPLRGLGRPMQEQVKQVLSILETCPLPAFVHCEHGCDRTGTIVACYRIQHDGWSAEVAMREARQYGLSWLERGMRKFILQFGKTGEKH